MKKLLLFMSFSIVAIFSANAQCTPDPQYTSPGIYPNEATGFVSGCVGVPYSQLVTNVVPADTVVIVFGTPVSLPINDIEITSFTGLPPGFTVVYYDGENTSNPVDGGIFEGGTTGCALITGTSSVAGTYDLTITVIPTVGGVAQSATIIDWYTIVIEDIPTISTDGFVLTSSVANDIQWHLDGAPISGATGQNHDPLANGTYTVEGNCGTSADFVVNDAGIEEYLISNFKLFPNPANDAITIRSSNDIMMEEIAVRSLSGNMVYSITPITTVHSIDISSLENGIYFVNVTSSTGTETIRFVKK